MKFIYSKSVQENEAPRITDVELVSRSLKNKFPKFQLTSDYIVYKGTPQESYSKQIITTRKVGDKFVVMSGYGQFSFGYVEV
ncbi:hypothetical protein [Leuconostoc mesenteroides]|uniref:hypothetical protein n=1 Tax=Leuconostoc mesenteroides TaxID=1245 RepID=UPI0023605DA4|nr:hypothetical protein [Leuconostoc mesenteroides]